MSLSQRTKDILIVAMADRRSATEVSAAIDAQSQAAAVADIAVPATATAEDCANKINALMASLRAAGILAV